MRGLLRAFSLLTAGSAFYLLVAGAHVNAYQAALSVPDWPLSYGHILAPDWPGNIFYEQHHRAAAGTTLVLFLATAAVLWRRGVSAPGSIRTATRKAAWVGGGALAVQILMGGLIVLRLNPPWLGALHVVVAIATVVAIAALALLIWSGEKEPASQELERVRSRSRTAIGLVFLAVALGSITRHPPAGELLFVSSLLAHFFTAVLLVLWLVLLALSVIRQARTTALRRWGWLLLTGVALQLAAGAGVLVVSPEPFDEPYPPPPAFPNLHAAHIVLAAFVVTCLVAVLLRSTKATETT